MASRFDFDSYSKNFEDTDFLRQTMRTIRGEPVSNEQIELVRDRIISNLELVDSDILLDICCGNGHLMAPLHKNLTYYTGIDNSPNLIRIANEYFSVRNISNFQCVDAVEFIARQDVQTKFSKALWYGALQYFSDKQVSTILNALHRKFVTISRVFIGNLPDREKAKKILSNHELKKNLLDRTNSPFGKWRSSEALEDLVDKNRWKCDVLHPTLNYHGSDYRIDLVLTRI